MTATRVSFPQARRQVWRCDNCHAEGVWGKGWSWWGSLRQMDADPRRLVIACSPGCRLALTVRESRPLPASGGQQQ